MKTLKVKVKNDSTSIKVIEPASYKKAIIIANGAGANMSSDFISYYHKELSEKYLTIKFNFLYQEKGKKAPDYISRLQATYRAVIDKVVDNFDIKEENIVLSGKSMGGRVASTIFQESKCKKLVLLGYPLHPPGRPEKLRIDHLKEVTKPMLFLSGTRDSLANLDSLKKELGKIKNAKLEILEAGDHSFKVTKKSGIDQDELFARTVKLIKAFVK